MVWLVIILWICLTWSFLAANWESICMNKFTNFEIIIVILIIFIGAPVFAWAGMLETILDLILPEGWNDDDDDEGKLP